MLPAGGSGGCGSLPSKYPPGRVPRQKQAPRGVRARCIAQGPVERTNTQETASVSLISTRGSCSGVQKLPFHLVDGWWQRSMPIPALRASTGPRAAPEAGPARGEGVLYSSMPSGGHIHPKKLLQRWISMQKVLKWRLKGAFSSCCRPVAAVVADPCPPGIPRDTCRARSRPRAGGGRAA